MPATGRTAAIETGMAVISVDGEEIGVVKEVREDFFKVDVPRRPDFWLMREYIMECDHGEAKLLLPKSTLRRFKLGKPRHPRGGGGSDDQGVSMPDQVTFDRDVWRQP